MTSLRWVDGRPSPTRRLALLLYLQIVRQVLTWSGAWWFAFALAAGQIVPPLIGLAVWRTVFPASSQISIYYLAVLFVVATTASYENHTFSQSIYKGTISDQLVRPVPTPLLPIGENIALRIWISLFAMPIVLLVAVLLDVAVRVGDLLLAVPMWLVAGALRFLFTWCMAMTAFWTERVHAITAFGTVLMYMIGGNAVPVSLLPEGLNTIARFLPFYSMIGLPSETAAGQSSSAALVGLLVQAAWLVVFSGLAVLLWRRGLTRYTAVSG